MPILKELKQHKILLDTHVWVWMMMGNESLSKSFRKFLEKPLNRSSILISPMSIWEIGMLVEKKRIEIEMDVLDWVDQSLNMPGIQLCEITPRIAIHSTRLSGVVHADPVDRLLMATAYEENVVLVTCDQKILEYGKGSLITVYNPLKEE